ncbi:MAG: LacI family DNA-binding transcriptional regulator [Anaerolineae bacterium]|nr:LacI family DNA-binding transcriptional regulator [Phycisphaerae bacterium]
MGPGQLDTTTGSTEPADAPADLQADGYGDASRHGKHLTVRRSPAIVAGRTDRGASRKSVSLRDVAKMAKVSVATVSMVLNDNPRISRATHLRVQRLMDRMGYQPNRLAQSLSGRYTQVLAVLLPALRHAFADAYFGELISGICDRAGKLGYKIMIEQAKPEFIREQKHVEIFERRYIDGILCLGTNDRNHYLEVFKDGRYPAMIVDNYFNQWKLDNAVCDYRSGAEQVMNYLMQLGHRKIALLAAAPEISTARDVREIYLQKLAGVNAPLDESWIEDGEFTEEGGAEATKLILRKHPDVTAIFATNDKMAVGALHLLSRLGIDVPRDISVVGFDDLQHAAFVVPSLTTVHLPLYQVGSLACERLIEKIRGRMEPVGETLSTHLVVRDSTAMVRIEEKLNVPQMD